MDSIRNYQQLVSKICRLELWDGKADEPDQREIGGQI
jgi:hypothetical protein